MKKIVINKITGENCITKEDGQKIFDLIILELKSNNSVELDFSNVKVFASPFFNFSIGKLFKDFTNEDLKVLLKVSNLTEDGLNVLERVIENSKQYFSNEQIKDAQNEVIKAQLENE